MQESIENKISDEEITTLHDDLSAIIKIKNMNFGSKKADIKYRITYSQYNSILEKNENLIVIDSNISCEIYSSNGKIRRAIVPALIPDRDKTSEELEARNWELIHDGCEISENRLKKSKIIWDKVYGHIISIPSLKQYLDNYKDYFLKKSDETRREFIELEIRHTNKMREMNERLKDIPDPLDAIIHKIIY